MTVWGSRIGFPGHVAGYLCWGPLHASVHLRVSGKGNRVLDPQGQTGFLDQAAGYDWAFFSSWDLEDKACPTYFCNQTFLLRVWLSVDLFWWDTIFFRCPLLALGLFHWLLFFFPPFKYHDHQSFPLPTHSDCVPLLTHFYHWSQHIHSHHYHLPLNTGIHVNNSILGRTHTRSYVFPTPFSPHPIP